MGTVHAKEAEAASSGPVSLQSVNAQVTKVMFVLNLVVHGLTSIQCSSGGFGRYQPPRHKQY